MKKLIANVYEYEIKLFTNAYSRLNDLKTYSELYIPDIKFYENGLDKPEYNIYAYYSNKKNYIKEGNSIFIEDSDKDLLINDTIMTLSRLFDKILIENGYYIMHSSAVSKDENAILFSGISSAGKTTSALKLCLEYDDIKFCSGDKTVLKEDEVIGGTKRTHVRKGSILYELPKLKKYFNIEDNENIWNEQVYLRPSWVNIKEENEKKLKAIIFPKKLSLPLKIKKLDKRDAFLRIHENLTYFYNYPHLLVGQELPLNINIKYKDKVKVTKYAKFLSENINVFTVDGKLDEITDFAISLFEDDYEKHNKEYS